MRLELSAEKCLEKERIRELVEKEKRRSMCEELKDSMSEANKLRDKKLEEEKQYEDFYTQKVCYEASSIQFAFDFNLPPFDTCRWSLFLIEFDQFSLSTSVSALKLAKN